MPVKLEDYIELTKTKIKDDQKSNITSTKPDKIEEKTYKIWGYLLI